MASEHYRKVSLDPDGLGLLRDLVDTTSYAHVGPGHDVDRPAGTETHPDRTPWWDTPETRHDPDDE